MKKKDQHMIGDFTELLVDRIAEKVVERLKEEGLVMVSPSSNAKDNPPKQTMYNIKQVCERLSISKETLHNHRRCGLLKASYYVGRSPRFSEEDIKDYLNKFKRSQGIILSSPSG